MNVGATGLGGPKEKSSGLTVHHPSRVGVAVGGVGDGPPAQVVGLLHTEIVAVPAVQHPVGVRFPAARGKQGATEAHPFIIYVVEAWTLQKTLRLQRILALHSPAFLWPCPAEHPEESCLGTTCPLPAPHPTRSPPQVLASMLQSSAFSLSFSSPSPLLRLAQVPGIRLL